MKQTCLNYDILVQNYFGSLGIFIYENYSFGGTHHY